MILVVIALVICSGVAAMIAHAKDRSVGEFAVAGLLLGVIGVIWAACARSGAEISAEVAARRRVRSPLSHELRDAPPLVWRDDTES